MTDLRPTFSGDGVALRKETPSVADQRATPDAAPSSSSDAWAMRLAATLVVLPIASFVTYGAFLSGLPAAAGPAGSVGLLAFVAVIAVGVIWWAGADADLLASASASSGSDGSSSSGASGGTDITGGADLSGGGSSGGSGDGGGWLFDLFGSS